MKGMHERTRKVWRAIHAAGTDGLNRPALNAALEGAEDLTTAQLEAALRNMRMSGYLQFDARRQVWLSGGRVPPAEQGAEAGGAVSDANADVDGDDEALALAPVGMPKGVPNSVFALGALMQHGTADPKLDPVAPKAAISAPAAASPLAWKAAPRRELPAPVAPAATTTAAPVPRTPAAATAEQPAFALHSNGRLQIDPVGDGIVVLQLSPTTTRALFRWLDCLGGTQLHRIVEEGATA